VNTNNGVKWRRFIVPKNVEQINDHLFIDTYKTVDLGYNACGHAPSIIQRDEWPLTGTSLLPHIQALSMQTTRRYSTCYRPNS